MGAIPEAMNEEQQAAVDRARAFGLMVGLSEALAYRVPEKKREAVLKLIEEARELWNKHEKR